MDITARLLRPSQLSNFFQQPVAQLLILALLGNVHQEVVKIFIGLHIAECSLDFRLCPAAQGLGIYISQKAFHIVQKPALRLRSVLRLGKISGDGFDSLEIFLHAQQRQLRKQLLLQHLDAALDEGLPAARQNCRMRCQKRQQPCYPRHLEHRSHSEPVGKAAHQRRLGNVIAQQQPVALQRPEVKGQHIIYSGI